MSRWQKWRGLCSSSCKGRVAFDCRLHPIVRRQGANLDGKNLYHYSATSDPSSACHRHSLASSANIHELKRGTRQRGCWIELEHSIIDLPCFCGAIQIDLAHCLIDHCHLTVACTGRRHQHDRPEAIDPRPPLEKAFALLETL